jgi:hypothetical protein
VSLILAAGLLALGGVHLLEHLRGGGGGAAAAGGGAAGTASADPQLEGLLALARALDPTGRALHWSPPAGAGGGYCAFDGVTCEGGGEGGPPPRVTKVLLDGRFLLRGSLPAAPEVPAQLPHLRELQVVSGKLRGPLPPALGGFSQLERLEVSGSLEGTLPAEWRGMQRLKSLSL